MQHLNYGTFDKEIKDIIKESIDINYELLEKKDTRTENKLNRAYEDFVKDIINLYSYIYIPTEVSINDFSKIEKEDIQKLTGKNVFSEIDKIITERKLTEINKKLEDLIIQISEKLDNYTYKTKNSLKNIKMSALTTKIVEEYFSLRVLSKKSDRNEDINVNYLSSGEKRKALIELSKAFLMTQKSDDKYIIFAVDEPEASLNNRARFKQFDEINKIKDISNSIQVLISTHWYAHLSFINEGIVNLLYRKDGDLKIDSYNLFNVQEKINQTKKKNFKDLPNDITLKSINDLIQSIIISLQAEEPFNWLICEGSSDKIYLDYYLKDIIKEKKLVILPVGGAKEVKRVFEHLSLPLKDYKDSIKGKVFCLIDTDEQRLDFFPNIIKNGDISFKRILFMEGKICLKENNYNINTPTEIEDALDSEIFIKTLEDFDDENIIKILNDDNNIRKGTRYSFECLDLRGNDQKLLKNFFDINNGSRKIEFANKYVLNINTTEGEEKLEWIEEIKEFFR